VTNLRPEVEYINAFTTFLLPVAHHLSFLTPNIGA